MLSVVRQTKKTNHLMKCGVVTLKNEEYFVKSRYQKC